MDGNDNFWAGIVRDIFGLNNKDILLNSISESEDNTNSSTSIFTYSRHEDNDNEENIVRDERYNEATNNHVDIETGPQSGMFFENFASILNVYQNHAKAKGFNVAVRSSRRDKNNEFKYMTIACDNGRNIEFKK